MDLGSKRKGNIIVLSVIKTQAKRENWEWGGGKEMKHYIS